MPRTLASFAFATLSGVSALCSPHAVRMPTFLAQVTPAATDAADADALRPAERTFIVQEAESSRTLTELSRLAVSQATSSEVRNLAQQIATDNGEMDRALESLARRKSVDIPLQPTSYGNEYRGLSTETGSAFDRAYVRRMSAASQHQLQVCENVLGSAKDPDVRELAGRLLPMLRDHVNKAIALEKAL